MMSIETIIERPVNEQENPMIPQAVQFFHTMLDTIANATQLAKDVRELGEEVKKLRVEVEEVHTRNATLTETINQIRTERDNYAEQAAHLGAELRQTRTDLEFHSNGRVSAEAEITRLHGEHAQTVSAIREERENTVNAMVEERSVMQGHLKEVTQERDRLAKELAETQGRFQELDKRLREIVGSLPQVTVEASAPQEEWRTASGY
jgi:chromosome segregation ATPase